MHNHRTNFSGSISCNKTDSQSCSHPPASISSLFAEFADSNAFNARTVTVRQSFVFCHFSAIFCASSSVSCSGPFIEMLIRAFRVISSSLFRCLVLTRHRVENPRSGQAVARGIDNAMQQSRCSSGNICWNTLSRAILLQTSPGSWQNSNSDIVILSFNV